jgi:hypothetical protein
MEIAGLEDVFSFPNTYKFEGPSRGCTVVAEVHKWLREQGVSFYRQGLENVAVRYEKDLNMFGD